MKLYRKVTYVLRGPCFGIKKGWVVMGFHSEMIHRALIVISFSRGRLKTLKCLPEYFDAILAGRKTFEVRIDDRTPRYEVGDVLELVRTEKIT